MLGQLKNKLRRSFDKKKHFVSIPKIELTKSEWVCYYNNAYLIYGGAIYEKINCKNRINFY